MKKIGQIFSELRDEGFFSTQHYLGTDSMLSNSDILRYKLTSINREKYIYILNIKNENDIILGEKFNVIFDIKNPKNYQKTETQIDFVTLKKDDNIGLIPKGQSGCIRLIFKEKVPEILNILTQDSDEKYDKEKHSHLYFTTQEVMDKILEELEKQENPIV